MHHPARPPAAIRWWQVFRIAATALLATGLLACGGGGTYLPPADTNLDVGTPQLPGEDTTVPDEGALPEAEPANRLVLTLPGLAGLAPGTEFDAVLSGEFVEEVYQGSCRLSYDPAVYEPVSAEVGGLVLADMVTLADTAQDGFVPFAFTALPGGASIPPGSGGLLTVRFRLLGQPGAGARIRLLNEPEFLQLRDRNSRRLRFNLESVMEGRQ
jgi:hypothetical protein